MSNTKCLVVFLLLKKHQLESKKLYVNEIFFLFFKGMETPTINAYVILTSIS